MTISTSNPNSRATQRKNRKGLKESGSRKESKARFHPAPFNPIVFALFSATIHSTTGRKPKTDTVVHPMGLGLTMASAESLMELDNIQSCFCGVCYRMHWLKDPQYNGHAVAGEILPRFTREDMLGQPELLNRHLRAHPPEDLALISISGPDGWTCACGKRIQDTLKVPYGASPAASLLEFLVHLGGKDHWDEGVLHSLLSRGGDWAVLDRDLRTSQLHQLPSTEPVLGLGDDTESSDEPGDDMNETDRMNDEFIRAMVFQRPIRRFTPPPRQTQGQQLSDNEEEQLASNKEIDIEPQTFDSDPLTPSSWTFDNIRAEDGIHTRDNSSS